MKRTLQTRILALLICFMLVFQLGVGAMAVESEEPADTEAVEPVVQPVGETVNTFATPAWDGKSFDPFVVNYVGEEIHISTPEQLAYLAYRLGPSDKIDLNLSFIDENGGYEYYTVYYKDTTLTGTEFEDNAYLYGLANYVLDDDIDLGGYFWFGIGDSRSGSSDKSFAGTFDGNGKNYKP